MEHKLRQNQYHSVGDWEHDVTLMYKNCIDYNRGSLGQWFRNEANQQMKVYGGDLHQASQSSLNVCSCCD
jgi:hypothetical protein